MREELNIAELVELRALLERRMQIITDTELRESDPDAQLAQLQEVGQGLFAAHDRLKDRMPGQLDHFFERCSYDKALDFVIDLEAVSRPKID